MFFRVILILTLIRIDEICACARKRGGKKVKIDRKKVTSIMILLSLMITLVLRTTMAFSSAGDQIIELEPSGDMTGVTDANNLEVALEAVKASGGTVELEDGSYYVSRPIVVEGFNGILKGDSMKKSIIIAVRGPDNEGFGLTTNNPPGWPLPMLFSFPFPTGKLVVEDLTLQAKEYKRKDGTIYGPADLYADHMGFVSHAMHVFIVAWGGDCKTVVNNVKLKGADGDFFEKNIKWPVVRALGEGDIFFENCEFENIGGNCWDVFNMKNSFISIKENICDNGRLIYHVNNLDSHTIIEENTVSGIAVWDAIFLGRSENVHITENTFKDFTIHQDNRAVIYLYNSHDCTISENTFIKILSDGIGKGAIRLRGGSSGNTIQGNYYSMSGLPGWTDCTVYPPEGLGYLLLDPSTNNNYVYECIPDNQVCDWGIDNTIITDYPCP